MAIRLVTFGRGSGLHAITPGRNDVVAIGVICAAYVLSAAVGFRFSFATQQVTAVWPPAGIALAAFLLRGTPVWPGVFVGALVSNALSHEPLLTAAGIALGNTLGPLIGAVVLKRVATLDTSLSRLRDVFWLALLGCALAMVITATNGVINLALAGLVPWSQVSSVWAIWWIGDAMGALLVAPLILACSGKPETAPTPARIGELVAVCLIAAASAVLFFSSQLPLAYPILPIVMWTAVRFEQRETTAIVLLLSGVALWQTTHGRGPFVTGSLDVRLGLLVSFMAVLSLTGLALGAMAAERRRAEASLQRANDELEERVRARTSELAKTNEALERRTAELARKNEEVEAFVYIVSHDLRAPLVNLQGFSRELAQSCDDLAKALTPLSLPEDAARSVHALMQDGIGGALTYISASVSKFERLITALLKLSRTGQQTYHLEPLDMDGIVASTLATLRQSIDRSGARITVGALPPAFGDATAIGQVFSNLVDNAVKYLDPLRAGAVEISGQCVGAQAHFVVRDNGVGIPDSAQTRLFHVFQRFHPDMAPGDGIGLAAIKRIVERHRGKLWFEGEKTGGTAFHFTLPSTATPEVS
jgi:signal transduction histidine kinase